MPQRAHASSRETRRARATLQPDGPIAVMRPWAPPAHTIAPYLEQMDAARWYSNFGPLNQAFEQRLAARFSGETHIVTAANGTSALAMALRVLSARAKPGALCMIPAWSFSASAHAALLAGLTPFFVDIDARTGALSPDIARAALASAPGEVAAIMPVSAFGAPFDAPAWATFQEETGVPALIDAAAGFDSVREAPVPVVVSLHATKVLGAGEGGFIATRNAELAELMRAQSSYGFMGSRISRFPAMNAKMSEYHAAVGLAALDHWPATRERLLQAGQNVRAALGERLVRFQPGWSLEWVSNTCVIRVPNGQADLLSRRLAARNISTRDWWGRGLHREPAFRDLPRAPDLSAVSQHAGSHLGLPFAIDLSEYEIARIAEAVSEFQGAR